MSRFTRHVTIPALAPLLFFVVASTPVETLGCRNRGLLAFSVSLASGLTALGSALVGARGRFRGDVHASWYLITTVVLTVPVVAMLALA